MARIYANLIKKGMKTIDDVPEKLKKAVQTDCFFLPKSSKTVRKAGKEKRKVHQVCPIN